MPTPPELKVLLDTAQQRIAKGKERISITVGGVEFNGPYFENTWITPTNDTAVLLPSCLTPAWHTSNSGATARLDLAAFGLTAGTGGWAAKGDKDGVGPSRLYNPNGMTAPVLSSASYGKNRGFFYSYYDFNVGNSDAEIIFESGFSNTGDGTAGVSIRHWSGGKVEVYKDGILVQTGNLGNKSGTQTANNYVDILVLPMRKRELLIYSITGGDSFVVVFEDILETDTDPTITLNEKYWWWVKPPATGVATVDVEIAPLTFAESGYVTSLEVSTVRPPWSGAALEVWDNPLFPSVTNARVLGDPAYAGTTDVDSVSLVLLDNSGAFVPDGDLTSCRVKATMSGDGSYTPFLRATHQAYASEYENTDDSELFDITGFIVAASLTVGDEACGVKFTFTVKSPLALDSLDVAKLLTVSNRPCQVLIGEILILEGVTSPAKFDDQIEDQVMRATIEVRDGMGQLQDAMFRERMPFDGMDLCKSTGRSAVQFLYQYRGLANLDLDDVDFKLSEIPAQSSSDFAQLVEVGAKPSDELERLHSSFASSFLYGIRPTLTTPAGVFKDPAGFSSTPDLTLYRTAENAIADGVDADVVDDFVYWSFSRTALEIEANEFRATGYNFRQGKAIQSWALDEDSQDPTLAPSARPDNWLGEPRVMGIVEPRLTTQEDCDRVVAYVFPQVSARYFIAEWESIMLFFANGVPIWRGDLVRLEGRGDFRVSSIEIRFEKEPNAAEDDPIVFRSARYTGGTLTNAGGIGLEAIKQNHRRRAVEKTIVRSGGERLIKKQVRNINGL